MKEGVLIVLFFLAILSFYIKVYYHIKVIKSRRNLNFRGIVELFNIVSVDTIMAYFLGFIPLKFLSKDQLLGNIFWLVMVMSMISMFWIVSTLQSE
jgi:hypothetical protein